jgi:hypothetical protein
MNRIDRRSLVLIIVLLMLVIALALVYDLPLARRFDVRRGLWGFGRIPFRARGLGTLVRTLAGITATIGVGSIALLFVPQRLQRMLPLLRWRNGMVPIIGIAGVLGSILLALLALVSVVATPFVPLIALSLLGASAFGLIAVVLRLGQWLRVRVHGEPNLVVDLIIGVLMLALGMLVPVVGRLVWLTAICWGVGTVALSRAGSKG